MRYLLSLLAVMCFVDLSAQYDGGDGSGDFSLGIDGFLLDGREAAIQIYFGGNGNGDDQGEILSATLPVELVEWKGKLVEDVVLLMWRTATELNNDYFTVEKSYDAEVWEELGRVDGAGTTNEEKRYSLKDTQVAESLQYYRLKQTDFDGAFSNYEVIAIETVGALANQLKLYPNPVDTDLFVQYGGKFAIVSIWDLTGALVELVENFSGGRLVVGDLKPGIYLLQLESMNGTRYIARFTKK